jgi:hypothetical protein
MTRGAQLATLAVALLVAGCGSAAPSTPGVALIPSIWEVASVRGTTIDGATLPVLAIERSNLARLELACGEVDLRYASGTSGGTSLSFVEQRVAATCATPIDPDDIALRAAIADVEGWRVMSDTSIELLDQGGGVLVALRATTCDCPHQPPGTGGPTSS